MRKKRLYNRLSEQFKSVISSDKQRRRFLFSCVIGSLFLISLCMGTVNFFTGEHNLLIAALLYSALCFSAMVLLHGFRVKEDAVYFIFAAGTLSLLVFFFITGESGGLTSVWMCLIPSYSLFIFGLRNGSLFSLSAFLILLFFFATSVGNSLLQYPYSDEFKLRFPFFYGSVFLLSFIIELVRKETQRQLEASKRKFRHLYCHDYLTGLYNRYGIREFGIEVAEKATGLSVILFDIDDFKLINDKYGHDCGDEVLKAVANTPLLRAFEEGRCCRWGGEEFLFVLGCENGAEAIAEDLRAEIEKTPIRYGDNTVYVTISAGVCSASKSEKVAVHDLIDKADKALYRAKSTGKNRVSVYDCKITETVL